MDFINDVQLPARRTVLASQKSRWIAFVLLIKSPGHDWAYLVENTLKHYLFTQLLSGFHFVWAQFSLPPAPLSFSQYYWPSRISYHTCPRSHSDCPYGYIHRAMGHLLLLIDMVPALLEMNSWQRSDFLPVKTASPALSKALFMFGQKRIGAAAVRMHHLNLIKLWYNSWLTPSEMLMAAKSMC